MWGEGGGGGLVVGGSRGREAGAERVVRQRWRRENPRARRSMSWLEGLRRTEVAYVAYHASS